MNTDGERYNSISELNNHIRIYYDAEFTGLHRNTTLVSIGLVTDHGSRFYAEFTDYDRSQVNDWIQENVIDKLEMSDDCIESIPFTDQYYHGIRNVRMRGETSVVREELCKWLKCEANRSDTKQVQFYTDCYAYDWMLLVDLITDGKSALDMPGCIYYIPIDLSTVLWSMMEDEDVSRITFAEIDINRDLQHSSIADAETIRECFHRIRRHQIPHRGTLIYKP